MNFLMRALVRAMVKRSDAALIKACGGAAREAGGRTLDPRFQFLEHQARQRPMPDAITPEMVRAQTRQMVELFGGKRERGVTTEVIAIPAELVRSIPARLYHPAKRNTAMGVLVYYHFGGGVIGDLDTCDAFCSILANALEGPVLSVDYRLAPEHPWPAGLEDAIAAYRWAAANADRLGAARGRIAVGGDSMGGNFSAIVAQEMKRTDGPRPDLQLLIYPATDLVTETPSLTTYADAFPLTRETMDWFMANYLPAGQDPGVPRISPGREPDLTGLPPALIYTAGFDPLVDQGAAYAQQLSAAGVETSYHCFDTLAHGFTAFTGVIPAADAACRRMAREAADFLRKLS